MVCRNRPDSELLLREKSYLTNQKVFWSSVFLPFKFMLHFNHLRNIIASQYDKIFTHKIF